MSQITNNILSMIERTRVPGSVNNIPVGMGRLGKHVFIAKKVYHLIGGSSGSGKSALADQMWVLNPFDWLHARPEDAPPIRYKVLIRSMERSKEYRVAKWLCQDVWRSYRVLMDVKYLFKWGDRANWISDDHYAMIRNARERIDAILEHVEIYDGAVNPTRIFAEMVEMALRHGTYYRSTNRYEGSDGTFIKQKSNGARYDSFVRIPEEEGPSLQPNQSVYVPHDENLILMGVVDHIGKLAGENKQSGKEIIDLMSSYASRLRDSYGMAMGVVSQFNRNISDVYRRVKTDLTPEDADFAGSSNMFHDCDVALALFNPYQYGKLEHEGYSIRQMTSSQGENRYRSLYLIKNTYGAAPLHLPTLFVGEVGRFSELKPPDRLASTFYPNVQALQVSYDRNEPSNSTNSGLASEPDGTENLGPLFGAQGR